MSESPMAGEERLGGAATEMRPSGTVTFLFTDVEGSTRLWETASAAMAGALERHDAVVRAAIEARAGVVFATGGDGFAAAFSRASDAVAAAVAAQDGLASVDWPDRAALRVRMGLHSGEAVERHGDYFGPAVNVAARLMSLAHGGQVVCSCATASLVGASAFVSDLGAHRLRDVPVPVRVFQVGVGQFPPLRSGDTVPNNLPVPLTSFVGRERELREVAAALEGSRLVTLVGVGGMGKTRLAIHVAGEVSSRFPDGVYLVELAAVTDRQAVAHVIAATLGVTQRPGVTLEDSIAEALRERELLLVLDNCEHVLTAVASVAERLLTVCGRVRVLATSREALMVEGEQLWPVGPLSLPSGSDDQEATAVRLFVDRARCVDPHFEPDSGAMHAIVEICHRLDGMPLAIELAASRMASMAPAEIAQLLDERFRLLTGGRRTAVERHQSLRAALDWSYGLLAEAERRCFNRLGVFAGRFDAAAAAAVVSDDDLDGWAVRDALSSLVAKSLVGRVEGANGTTRYQLAETLRAFARERLDDDDVPDRWRLRHAEHFTRFAQEAAVALRGKHELAWWPVLEAELDDLRAAVLWAFDSANRSELAVEIIANFAYVNQIEPRYGIGDWAIQALPAAAGSDPARRAVVRSLAAGHLMQTGSAFDVVRPIAEAAAADGIAPECPAPAVVFLALATCTLLEGSPHEAAQTARDALIAASGGAFDASHLASMHCIASAFSSSAGEYDHALRHAELALTYAREAQTPSVTGLALSQIGWAVAISDPTRAEQALTEAIALAESGAHLAAYDTTLAVLARLKAAAGHRNDAARYMQAAIAEALRQGDGGHSFLSGTLKGALTVAAHVGELELAAVLAGAILRGELRRLPAAEIITPGGEPHLAEVASDVREELGDAAYQAAEHRGASMNIEEVAAHALAALEAAGAETR